METATQYDLEFAVGDLLLKLDENVEGALESLYKLAVAAGVRCRDCDGGVFAAATATDLEDYYICPPANSDENYCVRESFDDDS